MMWAIWHLDGSWMASGRVGDDLAVPPVLDTRDGPHPYLYDRATLTLALDVLAGYAGLPPSEVPYAWWRGVSPGCGWEWVIEVAEGGPNRAFGGQIGLEESPFNALAMALAEIRSAL